MEESKTSVQGRVIRDLIARFASDNLIGRKLKTGELRKKMVEPAWKCPDCFLMQKIKMPQFEMELLTCMVAGILEKCEMPTAPLPDFTARWEEESVC